MLKFADIADSSKEKRMPESSDKTNYIGLEHLDTEDLEIHRWGSDVDITGQKLVMKKGDLLFGRRNTYLRRAAIAPHDGLFSAHGMILRPNTKVVDVNFFPFFVLSDYFMDAAIRISVGSLSPTVNWSTLKELEFSLPPLAEQKKLAETLWAMERVKRAYKNLLAETDRLTEARFVEMFGTCESQVCLDRVCSVIQDGEHGSVPRVDDGFLFISTRNVRKNHTIDLSVVTYIGKVDYGKIVRRFNPEPGDVLLTCAGTIGNTVIVPEMMPFVADRGIMLLKPIRSLMESRYLLAVLDSRLVSNQLSAGSHGTALKHIFINQVKKIIIPLPPLALQREFAAFVAQAEKAKSSLQSSLAALTAAQKSLMNSSFAKAFMRTIVKGQSRQRLPKPLPKP